MNDIHREMFWRGVVDSPVSTHELELIYNDAATLISECDGLVITAGAGIGIDSGLPDYRGLLGFWRAYPGLWKYGMRFEEVASPGMFKNAPRIAWGFYGHRLNLYRKTKPHAGFAALLKIASQTPHGARVFTSNVDGQFQTAGFGPETITECHGSIHYLQCIDQCGQPVWHAVALEPVIDEETCTLLSELPTCPSCAGLARPNIMMFDDPCWDQTRTIVQRARLDAWLCRLKRPVVIEIGAGMAIPTVRWFGGHLDCPMIRINPNDATVGLKRNIAIPVKALEGISTLLEKFIK